MTSAAYLTTAEAAEILGQSPRTIRRKAERGLIPFAVKGRDYWFSPEVIHYIAKQNGGRNDSRTAGNG